MKARSIAAMCVALLLPGVDAAGVILDRIAATVGDTVITTSEIEQYETLRIVPPRPGEDEYDYERRVLRHMIEKILQHRDVQRFGVAEVSEAEVDEALSSLISRFGSREDFEEALETSGLSIERLRMILRRELEIANFVQLRFSPMVFVSLEEIENYYRDVWVDQRLRSGEPILPLANVRDQIRAVLKSSRLREEIERWTEDLRDRTNVDVFI